MKIKIENTPMPTKEIQYVIRPTAQDDHGMDYPCEPPEATCFSLFEVGEVAGEPQSHIWVADFLRETDALTFSEILKTSHL